MNIDRKPREVIQPRWVIGLLISAGIIALGMIASVALREAGMQARSAWFVVVGANLLGALVFDLSSRRDGWMLGAMAVLMLLASLPLLWVPDEEAWIRENPLTFGGILLLAGYLRQKYLKTWPLVAVALILGSVHILISFL